MGYGGNFRFILLCLSVIIIIGLLTLTYILGYKYTGVYLVLFTAGVVTGEDIISHGSG